MVDKIYQFIKLESDSKANNLHSSYSSTLEEAKGAASLLFIFDELDSLH